MSLDVSNPPVWIQEHICFKLNHWRIEVEKYLGKFSDVAYFKVKVHPETSQADQTSGLLRIGEPESALSRELHLRDKLGSLRMVAELLAAEVESSVQVVVPDEAAPALIQIEPINELQPAESDPDQPSEYLEDYFLPEKTSELCRTKQIVLSYFPECQPTLSEWLMQSQSLESCVALMTQICQVFRQAENRAFYCVVAVRPEFIQIAENGFVQFFDLAEAYPRGTRLPSGLVGDYYAPELTYAEPISESMPTYVVGCLLYQAIHHRLPKLNLNTGALDAEIEPLPIVSQILQGCFAPAGDRFSLEQLMRLLIETRKRLQTPIVQWEVAAYSTTGLAHHRLQNEDSYAIRQAILQPNTQPLTIAAIADGMGGLSQGEVASQLAAQTISNAAIPTPVDIQAWIESAFQRANTQIMEQVNNGGTTLSCIAAIGRQLAIGHIGDSRIYLLRNQLICQLSIDHSLPAMLLASGEIDTEQLDHHPDRSVLTKCLGSKRMLQPEDVQSLRSFGEETLTLENNDILLLCSDGVWDLISPDELATLFSEHSSLQASIDQAIQFVLERDALDNATLIALKCRVYPIRVL